MGRRKRKPQKCTLCGRNVLVNGVLGSTGNSICSACATAARETHQLQNKFTPYIKNIPTPQELISSLDKSIIGQQDAKQVVAVAVWKQLLRADGDKTAPRSALLLYGPTGCGKTALVREAAKLAGLPFISFDSSTITEAGYKGRDAQDTVHDLFEAYPNNSKAKYGIIFLDEVDKLSAVGGEERKAYSRGSQHALLKLLEGTEVQLHSGTTVDTENLLFILGGAFTGLDDIVRRRVKPKNAIGFSGDIREEHIDFTPVDEDLIAYGVAEELLGRISRRVRLNALTEEDMRHILLDSKLSVYKRYQKFFSDKGVQLEAREETVQGWVVKALSMGAGARGLHTVVEHTLEPLVIRLAEQKKTNERVVWYV